MRPAGIYTIKSGYQWKQNEGQQMDWWRAVWNRTNVPKHSFIFWLAMRCRLLTRERLMQMGIGQDIPCPLCGSHPETNAHLFFECEFSKACLEDTLNWLKTKQRNMGLQEIWKGVTRKVTGKTSRGLIWAILAALIYYIWQVRNDAVWDQIVPRTHMILQKIQMKSKVRIFEILKRKHMCKNRY
ncbi:hypothetical protein R3W88_023875 [Solanum pinnatisectum]|uniref:Reverse transcriptase zinc-binding domain-containing protein n=1 Tax=Solanum pinnatisectum TaxID=50273 RepID=A0AAV9M2I3_9SOLN|nr:hypothetical protein R3W88_023875 [Solanum pinnatisectum]